jgi:hypothetical protein
MRLRAIKTRLRHQLQPTRNSMTTITAALPIPRLRQVTCSTPPQCLTAQSDTAVEADSLGRINQLHITRLSPEVPRARPSSAILVRPAKTSDHYLQARIPQAEKTVN